MYTKFKIENFLETCTGAFYFVLGNIQPKLRQHLTNIQLLTLVKSTIVKEQGINQILEVLLKDIRKLETVSIIMNQ